MKLAKALKITFPVLCFFLFSNSALAYACTSYYNQPPIPKLSQLPEIPYEAGGINYTSRIIFYSEYARWQAYDFQEVYPFVQINGTNAMTFEINNINTIRFDDQNQQYRKWYQDNTTHNWNIFGSSGSEAVLKTCYVFNQSIYSSTYDVYFVGGGVSNSTSYYNTTLSNNQLMLNATGEKPVEQKYGKINNGNVFVFNNPAPVTQTYSLYYGDYRDESNARGGGSGSVNWEYAQITLESYVVSNQNGYYWLVLRDNDYVDIGYARFYRNGLNDWSTDSENLIEIQSPTNNQTFSNSNINISTKFYNPNNTYNAIQCDITETETLMEYSVGTQYPDEIDTTSSEGYTASFETSLPSGSYKVKCRLYNYIYLPIAPSDYSSEIQFHIGSADTNDYEDFFAGFSNDFTINSWHLIYPKEYEGPPFLPQFVVKPNSSFKFIFFLRHFSIPIEDGIALTFSKFTDDSFETVAESYGENELTSTRETDEQSIITARANIVDGETTYYRIAFYNSDGLGDPLASLPFIVTGDSSSGTTSTNYSPATYSYCDQFGTIVEPLCRLIVPRDNYFPEKMQGLKNKINLSMPFISQIYSVLHSGVTKLSNAPTIAPSVPDVVLFGATVNFLDFRFIDPHMATIRGYISAILWFTFLVFLIKKSSNI